MRTLPGQIRPESLASLQRYYRTPGAGGLHWPAPFSRPAWMDPWWSAFGAAYDLCLYSVWQGSDLLGLAPLVRREDEVRLLGSADVCDYLDFITVPGAEADFFRVLLPALLREGARSMVLEAQHPGAAVFRGLMAAKGPNLQLRVSYRREDESYQLALPADWGAYLSVLNKKQRHEARRKLRRLAEADPSHRYRVLTTSGEVEGFAPRFFELFNENPDKAVFLNDHVDIFFRLLLTATARQDLARFGVLEIGGEVAAAVLYFDYKDRFYLYNSGYLTTHGRLSAGLIAKLYCLQGALEAGRSCFDFLKGREEYKRRLGGRPLPIYRLEIEIA